MIRYFFQKWQFCSGSYYTLVNIPSFTSLSIHTHRFYSIYMITWSIYIAHATKKIKPVICALCHITKLRMKKTKNVLEEKKRGHTYIFLNVLKNQVGLLKCKLVWMIMVAEYRISSPPFFFESREWWRICINLKTKDKWIEWLYSKGSHE